MQKIAGISTKLFLTLNIIFILTILNFFYPVLRLSSRLGNYIFVMCILCIPFIIAVLGFRIEKLFKKILFIIAYGFVALISGTFIFFLLLLIMVSEESVGAMGFTVIDQVQIEGSRVTAYRTDGGATTALGIIVRHEKKILPGLLLVRDIYTEYPRCEIEFVIKNNILIIDGIEYELKRNVYY